MTENKSLSFAEFPDPNVVFPNEYGATVFLKNGLCNYERFGDKPARPIKKRFDDEMIALLQTLSGGILRPPAPAEFLPTLCNTDLAAVKAELKKGCKNNPTAARRLRSKRS